MEQDTIIYDLENEEIENPETSVFPESSEPTGLSETPDTTDSPEPIKPSDATRPAETPDPPIVNDPKDTAETEIRNMISEVGAETILQLIKDNRNAAIRQIISEIEASRDNNLPSGTSSISSCNSIFALAALA